jgi:hypothetical protein
VAGSNPERRRFGPVTPEPDTTLRPAIPLVLRRAHERLLDTKRLRTVVGRAAVLVTYASDLPTNP